MKLLLLCLIFIASLAVASQTQVADVHESLKAGRLPMPYGSFSVHIQLNESDHAVSRLDIKVGGNKIILSSDDMNKLKDIDLSHVWIGHEIFRDDKSPYKKLDEQSNDFFQIKISSQVGVEKNHSFYADYYVILVNLDTGNVKLGEVVHEKP